MENITDSMNNGLKLIVSESQSSDFIHFINQVGFKECKDVSPLVFNNVSTLNISDPQKPILLAGLGKMNSLEGNFTKAFQYFNQSYSIAKDQWGYKSDNDKDDILAYTLFEYGMFNLKLLEYQKANDQLDKSILYAESSELIALIEYGIELLKTKLQENYAIGELKKKVDLLKKYNLLSSYCLGLQQIGNYYLFKTQYSQAIKYLNLGLSHASRCKYKYIIDTINNSLGYLELQQNKYDEAISYFTKVIKTTESYYLRSIAMENIGAVQYYCDEFQKAADTFIEALQNSVDHNVVSQIPGICSLLGRIYSEKLNNQTNAKHFYKLGYEYSISHVQLGLSLTGSRESCIKQYNKFLNTAGYKPIEQTKITPSQDLSPENNFKFAIDKPWIEIRDLFHYNLFMFHRNKTNNFEKVLKNLNIIRPTYYSNHYKLTNKGFEFPHMKRSSKTALSSLDKIVPSLQNYIEGLDDKTWKGANDKFEKDIFRFLYHQYGYMKTNVAEKLEISYLTVRKKTEHVSQRKS